MSKKILIPILLINIIFISTLFGNTKGILSIALSQVSKEGGLGSQEIKNFGISAELLLPVQIINDNIFYKANILYHKLEYSNYSFQKKMYVASINELQFGYKIFNKNDIFLQSFFGFGIMVQHIYNPGKGYSYGSFLFDFSNYLMYDLKIINFGLKVSIIYSPWDGYFGSINSKYFQFGLCVSR